MGLLGLLRLLILFVLWWWLEALEFGSTIILCGWSILAALARVGVTRVHHIYPVRTVDTRRAS